MRAQFRKQARKDLYFMQKLEIPHLCDCQSQRKGVPLSAQIEFHQ